MVLPTSFGASRAAAWVAEWNDVCAEQELTLRLPSGAFLRPTGIVLLASGIARRQQAGLRTRLISDVGAESSFQYLQRIDFFSALGVEMHETVQRHDSQGRFVTLKRITDEATAHALAETSAACLQAVLGGGPSSPLRMARFVFEELGVNIVQHSEAPDTGFGVLQSLGDRIEIAFADSGIGFLASLQKNPEFAGRVEEEAEALQLAVGKGVTGTSAPRHNMGWGLALLQDFADRMDGDLWVASGTAVLRRRTLAGVRTTTVHPSAPWRGSWICLDAPLAPG